MAENGTSKTQDLGLPPAELQALDELYKIKRSCEEHLAVAFQFPEPAFRLDLGSRPSESRQFAHIHQMCLLHATHFAMATKIKTAYILDYYLWAARQLNPLAVYSGARSLLELHAVLAYTEHLLCQAIAGGEDDWQGRGQRYFDAILQARFGTSDPKAQQLLRANGCPENALRPLRIAKARAFLAQQLPWVEEHYALLCDFVHPNMSSQRAAGAYVGESQIARSSTGGQLLMSQESPLVQYKFPMPEAGRRAVEQTVTRALENVLGIVSATNQLPQSPFTEAELTTRTGSPTGLHRASLVPD